jgi:2-polyprenyl-3-methyl-5-hydroxy-6-metoxy-1,4-benzoquinol methylase
MDRPTGVSARAWPPWRCPAHGAALEDTGDALVCERGERFAVRRKIPRFVEGESYAAAFGAQWNRYRRTQLDSYTGTTISRDRVRRCLGDAWESLPDAHVLEAGCGAGRFTEVLLAEGALVTSIDLSEAVEANAENCPPGTRHRIAQADIMRPPFAPEQFDVVFCLGVVQHTPDSEATVAALYGQVRPGGYLAFDHYTYSKSRLSLVYVYRPYFRRLSPEKGLRQTERLVDLLLPLHKRAGRLTPLLTRVSPVRAYYRTHPQLPDEIQREWALLDTHDGLTDWYKHLRTRGQIAKMLKGLGAEVVRCEYAGNGVEALARKPV